MAPENWLTLVASLSTLIVTLASLYFKHRLDMAQYESTNRRVTKIQQTLENGVKTSLADTNRKVSRLTDDADAAAAGKKDRE